MTTATIHHRVCEFKAASSFPLAASFSERPPQALKERSDHICVATLEESKETAEYENLSFCVFRARVT